MPKFISGSFPFILSLSVILISCQAGPSLKGSDTSTSSSSSVKVQNPMNYTNGKFLGNIFGSGSMPLDFNSLWNQVTPENAGKWGSVQDGSSNNIWDWSTLDAIYGYAKTNGIPFKMHNFIWGQQQPSWITNLSTTNQTLAIIAWISNVGARYPSMDFIDVVNEPIHTPPPYSNAMGGSGTTGWDWVVFAYQQARKYCNTNAKLLVNEYSVENSTTTCAQYTNIIMILKASNLIDGIGVQCHDGSLDGDPTTTLSNCLGMMAATGLPIYVSEMDLASTTDSVQESLYKEYFPILWNYSDVKGITLWGYIEYQIWTVNGWLLSSSGTPRAALTWLMSYLTNY
jgi:endo-1,4-beta-xylanase